MAMSDIGMLGFSTNFFTEPSGKYSTTPKLRGFLTFCTAMQDCSVAMI